MNPLIELDLAGDWRFTPERGEPVFMSAGGSSALNLRRQVL